MKNGLILLVFFLICSCQIRIKKDNCKVIDLDFAKEQMNSINSTNLHFKDKSKTNLNDSEVNLILKILGESITSYNDKQKGKSEYIDIDEYRFFIIPMLTVNNEKIVLIYSYRFHPQNEWDELKHWFQVFDGGNSYFRTKINLTKKTEGRIIPNGEA